MELLPDEALDRSSVVANRAMNREREIAGPNSYSRDLGFDVLAYLAGRAEQRGAVAWLDLCCGSARALAQAAARLRAELPDAAALTIEGVDLVPMFDPAARAAGVILYAAPLRSFTPPRRYDLITCVHGLHYVGDKLDAVARAVRWLEDDGTFLAHIDLAHVRFSDDRPAARAVTSALRAAGLGYDASRRLIHADHPCELTWPHPYLGANDQAGPNHTGQPAVCSVYTQAT